MHTQGVKDYKKNGLTRGTDFGNFLYFNRSKYSLWTSRACGIRRTLSECRKMSLLPSASRPVVQCPIGRSPEDKTEKDFMQSVLLLGSSMIWVK